MQGQDAALDYDEGDNSAKYQHHMQVYGDPFSGWPYNKFLTGANDKSIRPNI